MSEEKIDKLSDNSSENSVESNPVGNVVSSTPAKEDTFTIKKDTLWKYSTFILAAILVVGAFAFFSGDSNTGGTAQVIDTPGQQVPTPEPSRVSANTEGYPSKGSDDAPVVLIEYSDYECPFCGRHYTQTYQQIISQYVDTGKVKMVFKDFPLSFHPNAQKAAEAAHCVRDQSGDEGYFSMHDKLFDNQQNLNVDNFKKLAREVDGVDGGKFDSCLDSGKFASLVQKGFAEGQQDGVRGTPGFLINGKPLSGAQPFSAFQQAIEAELA
jgi:protein-disulfide isomerase